MDMRSGEREIVLHRQVPLTNKSLIGTGNQGDGFDLLPARLQSQAWERLCGADVQALASSNAGKIGGQAARPISTR